MIGATLLAAGLLFSTANMAQPTLCDGAKVEITFEKSTVYPREVVSVITTSRDRRSIALRFDGGIDLIGAECRQSKRGKSYVVFQAYCGGSGCRDLDNYGIIDPKDLRVLLVPDDSNRLMASRILGVKVKPVEDLLSIREAYDKLFP